MSDRLPMSFACGSLLTTDGGVELDVREWSSLADFAEFQDLAPAVAHAVKRWNLRPPPAVALRLDRALVEQTALAIARTRELARLVDAFAAAGIAVLLLKGSALAYTVYAAPALRPRRDTDLLIADVDRDRAEAVLEALGYRPEAESVGAIATTQAHFTSASIGLTHHVDLHWRIAIPQRFRHVVEFGELVADSVPIPAISSSARGLSLAHAMLVACVHRVAHHFDRERLLWIYDIHLLAQAAGADDWRRFIAAAQAGDVRSACADGLHAAERAFGTRVPREVVDVLDAVEVDAATPFLGTRLRQVDLLRDDLGQLASWTDRARLLADHLFPPASYMRTAYAPGSRLPLVLLYARRIIAGAPRWFR